MNMNGFAPGWSFIPKTVRYSKTANEEETYFKSMIFRVHDFMHQLWGLPIPGNFDDDKERQYFKRMWMCAEISVLTVVEFFYCQWLFDTQPHLRHFLIARNTLLFKRTTDLCNKTMEQPQCGSMGCYIRRHTRAGLRRTHMVLSLLVTLWRCSLMTELISITIGDCSRTNRTKCNVLLFFITKLTSFQVSKQFAKSVIFGTS